MLRSERKRFLFVHIQKTGGMSVRSALLDAIPDLANFRGRHDTVREARESLGDAYDEYFTAAFVRNPWDRLVSWYTFIRERISREGAKYRLWQYVQDNSTTFDEFARNCTAEIEDLDGTKCVYRNQVDYLNIADDAPLVVKFIGRYENLAADASRLFTALGVEATLPHVNASSHSHYSAYYTDELAAIVGDRYARDVMAFGYRFERAVAPTLGGA